MSGDWLIILKNQVEAKGTGVVMKELDVSRTTLSLVLRDQYGASTENIEKKVMNIYGRNGQVNCQVLGEIEPGRCAENFQKAHRIGVGCGNPATMRLYKTCITCDLRNG